MRCKCVSYISHSCQQLCISASQMFFLSSVLIQPPWLAPCFQQAHLKQKINPAAFLWDVWLIKAHIFPQNGILYWARKASSNQRQMLPM